MPKPIREESKTTQRDVDEVKEDNLRHEPKKLPSPRKERDSQMIAWAILCMPILIFVGRRIWLSMGGAENDPWLRGLILSPVILLALGLVVGVAVLIVNALEGRAADREGKAKMGGEKIYDGYKQE